MEEAQQPGMNAESSQDKNEQLIKKAVKIVMEMEVVRADNDREFQTKEELRCLKELEKDVKRVFEAARNEEDEGSRWGQLNELLAVASEKWTGQGLGVTKVEDKNMGSIGGRIEELAKSNWFRFRTLRRGGKVKVKREDAVVGGGDDNEPNEVKKKKKKDMVEMPYLDVLEVDPEPTDELGLALQQKPAVEEVEKMLLEKIREWGELEYQFYIPEEFPITKYVAAMSMLESKHLYSRNISDLEGIKATIKLVAKIDRLPDDNTYEGMQVIQMAWDKVDIFNAESSKQKLLAKVMYVALLIIGSAISIVTVLSLNKASLFPEDTTARSQLTDSIIMGLTLVGSAIAAFNNFTKPSTKWQQLRGAALALESEIWKFRSRSGKYSTLVAGGERAAQSVLQEFVEDLKQSVLKSATVMNTSFLSNFGGLVSEIDDLDEHQFTHEKHALPVRILTGRVTKVYPGGNAFDVNFFDDSERQLGVAKKDIEGCGDEEEESAFDQVGGAVVGSIRGLATLASPSNKKLPQEEEIDLEKAAPQNAMMTSVVAAKSAAKVARTWKKTALDDDVAGEDEVDVENWFEQIKGDPNNKDAFKPGSDVRVTIRDEHDPADMTNWFWKFVYKVGCKRLVPGSTNKDTYKHGQYKFTNFKGTFGQVNKNLISTNTGDGLLEDDHHSPITWEQYLKFRVRPQLGFYQNRLPKYSRQRSVLETLMLLGSLAGTLLAYMKKSQWAALPAAVVAALTAWNEFAGSEKKLMRYSDSISGLDSILLWWRTLTDVEKASMANVDDLVDVCEGIFQNERQAWVSTSMNVKKAAKKGEEEEEGGGAK